MASSLFNLHAWQSFCRTSLQVLFGLPHGVAPSTSYSIHFSIQSLSSFCTHAHAIVICFAVVPRLCHLILVSLSLNSTWNSIFYLNATHPPDHSYLCPLKCHLISFDTMIGVSGWMFLLVSVHYRVVKMVVVVVVQDCLQCFDAVGWVAGRASGL